MVRTNTISVLILASGLLSGCGSTTSVVKFSSKQQDPASPPSGGFAFAMRTSAILLTPQAAPGDAAPQGDNSNKPAEPPSNDPAANIAKTKKKDNVGASAKTGKDSKPGATTPIVPAPPQVPPVTKKAGPTTPVHPVNVCGTKPEDNWHTCLDAVLLGTAPVSVAGEVYVVVPSASTGSKTTITPKVNDTDPLMLTSVTFNSSSKLPSELTTAGTDAIVGLAWGPWGAAAGGIIGLIVEGTNPNPGAAVAAPPKLAWQSLVCPGDSSKTATEDPADNPILKLPVTVNYAKPDTCWNSLPTSVGFTEAARGKSAPPSGWFYRFAENKTLPPNTATFPQVVVDTSDPTHLPIHVVPATTYFTPDKDGMWTSPDTTFPVSACRSVELQITFWSAIILSIAQKGTPDFFSYPLVVADPNYVQKITTPTQGSVTLLTLCGGYASAGTPSNAVDDSISALLTQVKAYRDAQTSAKKK
jgi:hypothetical protein